MDELFLLFETKPIDLSFHSKPNVLNKPLQQIQLQDQHSINNKVKKELIDHTVKNQLITSFLSWPTVEKALGNKNKSRTTRITIPAIVSGGEWQNIVQQKEDEKKKEE